MSSESQRKKLIALCDYMETWMVGDQRQRSTRSEILDIFLGDSLVSGLGEETQSSLTWNMRAS